MLIAGLIRWSNCFGGKVAFIEVDLFAKPYNRMKVKDFGILISSPYDREKLVAEIWYNDDYLAEINQEKDFLEIVFYSGGQKTINLPLEMLQEVLEKAKVLLIGK